MKTEDHLRNINESLESIEFAIDKGIENHQRNIGFNCSLAAVEMLEVYLHTLELINPGTIVKHDWFKSLRLANLRIPFDFPEKEKIIFLLIKMEDKRNTLCYGKRQPLDLIETYFNQYLEIKSILESKGLKWN